VRVRKKLGPTGKMSDKPQAGYGAMFCAIVFDVGPMTAYAIGCIRNTRPPRRVGPPRWRVATEPCKATVLPAI